MSCSPALLLVWLIGGVHELEPSRPVALLQLLFLAGWSCTILGLQRLSATGSSSLRVLLRIQLFGLALAGAQEFQDLLLVAPDRDGVLYRAADAAWPLSVLLMVCVGLAAARSGVFTGWQRVPAIACGLTLPLAMLCSVIWGPDALKPSFGLLTAVAWGALGYAVADAPDGRHAA